MERSSTLQAKISIGRERKSMFTSQGEQGKPLSALNPVGELENDRRRLAAFPSSSRRYSRV